MLANPLYGQVIVSHSFIVDYVSFNYINYIRSCSNEGGRGGTDHVTQSDLDSSNKSHIFIVDTFANNKVSALIRDILVYIDSVLYNSKLDENFGLFYHKLILILLLYKLLQ